MGKKQYIEIVEISDNEECGTKKWMSMKFFENLVYKIFTPIINAQIDSFEKSMQTLRTENEYIKRQLDVLTEKYKNFSEQVQKDSQNITTLLADYNTRKASSDTKYKDAINALYKLNRLFIQNVSTFGKANNLELLEKLVNYLYNPNYELRETILSQKDAKSASILLDIDDFNNNLKSDIVSYLNDRGVKWEDCVQFPGSKNFDSQIMIPFNDEIEEGFPVYIVSLGFAFPNSNSEKQLPNVFMRRTE